MWNLPLLPSFASGRSERTGVRVPSQPRARKLCALDKSAAALPYARPYWRGSGLAPSRTLKDDNMHAYRTHHCGQLRSQDVGQTVRLSGWVHRKRDHGGLLFVDLRDHYGLTQIVADSRSEEHTSELQSLLRTSYAVFCLEKKNKQLPEQRHKR